MKIGIVFRSLPLSSLSRKISFPGFSLLLVSLMLSACGGAISDGDNNSEEEGDPVAVDLPIAYVQRPLPVDEEGLPVVENILDPTAFNPGAELFIRSRASSTVPETNITAGAFPDGELYDIKDLSVSYDGTKLLFAMRAPEDEDADEDEQPTWNIWEYDRTTEVLRRIILSSTSAEEGQDVSPRYMADGRIVFSSTRQRRAKAILLDEGKSQYAAQEEDRNMDAFNLHTMADNGTDIQQISFNQSHDLYPTMLDDGRVMFLRWDNVNNNDSLSLYTINPDGSGLSFLYGIHSQNLGTNDSDATYWSPKMMSDGRVLTLYKQRESEILGGDLLAIDVENYTEIDQPVPGSSPILAAGQVSLSVASVATDDSPSPHGSFASAWPLDDGTDRIFVSWSLCRLQDIALTETLPCTDENLQRTDVEPSEPLYGLWMYDFVNESQQPILLPEDGLMYSDAVVIESLDTPTFIQNIDPEQEGLAVINIRSVYDLDGVDSSIGIETLRDPLQTTPDERPARFLRIVKAVSMPDDDTRDFDNSAFGAGGRGQLMREIIGYVPIEPDGSVVATVPSDIALSFSVLDADGHRTSQRHENWIHLAAGDTIQCNGCHDPNSEVAHGRVDAEPMSANPGALMVNQPFLNTEPTLTADEVGETMAEVWARINGPREPSVDIVFNDDWTDPAAATPATGFDWAYGDISDPDDSGLNTAIPVSVACTQQWSSRCRTVINYLEHIQPIWDLERPILDDMDEEVDNDRCTICHSPTDEVLMIDQLPAGQIDLRAVQSIENINYATSYVELFILNQEQEIDPVTGDLIFSVDLVQRFDEEGMPVLDEDDNPIFDPVRRNLNTILRAAGANSSNGFFQIFEAGASHEDYLTAVELKLISEWLDIGAQYYNNPFDAPLD